MKLINEFELDELYQQAVKTVERLFDSNDQKSISASKLKRQWNLIELSNRLLEFMPNICWHTEANLAKALCVSERQIKYAKVYLVKTGKIQIRCHPNGNRDNLKHYIYKVKPNDSGLAASENGNCINWGILAEYSAAQFNQLSIEEQLDIYAEMNLPFIPVHFPKFNKKGNPFCSCGLGKSCESIGKHPAIKFAELDFTSKSTFNKMRLEWLETDNRFNIGFLTNGFSVIDVDFRHGGACSLELIEEIYGELPRNLTSKSGNGFHIYTSSIIPSKVNLLGFRGIDVRSKGGFIVAPFSQHHSGEFYEWLSLSEPEPLPAELAEDILQSKENEISSESRNSTKISLPKDLYSNYVIPRGERAETLFKFAARERGRGKDYDEILAILDHINTVHCNPRLPRQRLAYTARSVCSRYVPNAAKAGKKYDN